MKRILILHISEFGGHSRAAENIKEALVARAQDIEVRSINGFGYFYPRAEKVIDFLYTLTIKHFPFIWGTIYDRKILVKRITPFWRMINSLTFFRFANFMKSVAPQCVVATQAFPCGLVASFKERFGLSLPIFAVVTDFYPHRFWIHASVDRYVVATSEARDILIREGVSSAKICVLGIPISIQFRGCAQKTDLAHKFGFKMDKASVLLMGGGLGIGPIEKIAKALDTLPIDFQIITICGKNKKLLNWFTQEKEKFKKPIFYFGYTNNVHEIMDFCDIIITKAGGITISEALAKGLGIIITKPIPGQEERNVQYLLNRQAIMRMDEISKIADCVKMLLSQGDKLSRLRQRAKEHSCVDSSLKIADLILETLG